MDSEKEGEREREKVTHVHESSGKKGKLGDIPVLASLEGCTIA